MTEKAQMRPVALVLAIPLTLTLLQAALASPVTMYCGDRVCGAQNGHHGSIRGRYRGAEVWDRVSIPTPAGTWRIARSCAQRLAAYWGLKGNLDSTGVWPRKFARASAPGPRVAVVVPGHVYGIVGGSPGAWRVVSFNGDGNHGNVEFTISKLRGILVDTTRPL
jgi:hypothetical protein